MILLRKFIHRFTCIRSYALSKNISLYCNSIATYSIYYIVSRKKQYYCGKDDGKDCMWLAMTSMLNIEFFCEGSRLYVNNAEVAKILATGNIYSKYSDLILIKHIRLREICEV